ncbi:RNA polymerase sigma factor [Halosquirtibacter xylanolyticus]|uniref:RNA polymerase sigma factor n=1 Tax=Halosquirtibacter xylanolyticus TaxID=3374599 RepID=UPI00374A8F08|nr:RNA polymerase sigma factor [Prolixibacteraceae bacterium]
MDDKTLVIQIKRGNGHAFEFLVNKYQKLVFHMIWKMGVHASDVEDVAQDIFIKIYQQIGTFREASKLSTWIASVAWRYSVDFMRKRHVYFVEYDEVSNENESHFAEDNFFSRLETEEKREVISNAIALIPPKYQGLMNLFYTEEFTYEEIVDITGIPLGSVKSNLNRARAKVKEIVEKRYKKGLKIERV